jgi:hypothetical protein
MHLYAWSRRQNHKAAKQMVLRATEYTRTCFRAAVAKPSERCLVALIFSTLAGNQTANGLGNFGFTVVYSYCLRFLPQVT